jgi:rhamnosyltransferase
VAQPGRVPAVPARPSTRRARARNPDYAARERYYWFSNNSRRSAARSLRWPFPEVEFAEDQAWARLVLEAGFRTALVPESLILHSPAYWPGRTSATSTTRAMRQDLGQTHA